MKLQHAPICKGGSGGVRHKWGREVRKVGGVTTAIYHQLCTKDGCPVIRITEYTRSGNHTAGYLIPDEVSA